MARIFISYSRDDGTDIATSIANRLRAMRHEVFLDIDSLIGSVEWENELRQRIAHCDLIIILVTPASNNSQWVYKEFEEARTRYVRILPVQLEDTTVPLYLRRYQIIKFRDNLDYVLLEIQRVLLESPKYRFTPKTFIPPIILAVILVAVFWFIRQRDINLTSRNFIATIRVPCPLGSLRPLISNDLAGDGAEISFPKNCTINLPNATRIDTFGTYSEDLEGKSLWILVYHEGYYWPQAIESCRKPQPYITETGNNQWRTSIILYSPDTQYDIVLLASEANGIGNQIFYDWLSNGCENQNFPGITEPELPDDLIELASFTVRTL